MTNKIIKIIKPDHISSSQIGTGKCKFKYYMTRLTNQIENKSVPMAVGSAVHEIIYKYTDWCFKNRVHSDADILNKIIDAVFDIWDLPEEEYLEVRKNMIIFGERGIEFDKILEYEKRETVEFSPGRFIQVILDRTNSYTYNGGSTLDIIDYKNSMKIFTADELENHEQLNKIYKYIACKFLYPGYDYVRTGIWHTRYNYCRYTDPQKISELSDEFENIDKFLNRQWVRLIESETYEPKKCEGCFEYGQCAVMAAGKCPLYSDKEVEKMKVGDIADKVRAYKKLDLDLKEYAKTIRSHFKNVPPKVIDGKKTGYVQSISYNYDLTKLLKYFKKNNIDTDGLTMAKTVAEKKISLVYPIKKMSPEQSAEVELMQNETISSDFRS